MADVLGALQAKVLVCRQCVGADGEDGSEEAAEDDTPEHVARVFASLKADIDMLNAHYQDAVTRLLCADAAPDVCTGEGVSSGPAVAAMAMDDAEAMVGDARVFELTMLSADALDAPDLAFEADAESTQQRPRPAQTAARSDRIRQQRERRAEEAAVRERRGDITTMMAELRSAVGTRAKGAMDASGGPAT
ncbi:hypothetical protein H4R21_003437 [Coemansia helicoidea]|uniref:Uncharacterized protein n=1 Tax=Coemansia helicoidea TaxID=1286919 RepID=A0ACC1L1S7_9FUNG|nr:hypothetical protein H4R21_003437 [Coemansia helicoidea]